MTDIHSAVRDYRRNGYQRTCFTIYHIHDLTSKPNPRGANVRVLDSGVGLANATLQQRLTVIRLFHDYLMKEGFRADNPVGRGRYTPGKGFGGKRDPRTTLRRSGMNCSRSETSLPCQTQYT